MKYILTLEQFVVRESLQTFYRGSTSNTLSNDFVWLSTSQKHAKQYADINYSHYKGDKRVDTFKLDISNLNILDLTMYDTDENLYESECSFFLSDINVNYDVEELYEYDDTIPLSRLLNKILHILMRNIDGFKIMESGIETICIRKELLNSVNESKVKKDAKRELSYGCVMLYFDFPEMSDIHKMIDKSDIYIKEGYGLEKIPHTTLLYGLHDDEIEDETLIFDKVNDILEPVKSKSDDSKIVLKLSNVSLFENEYDVLKFEVSSQSNILKKCNKTLCDNFPYTTDYPIYKPHCTIAYLNKGCGTKYVKLLKDKEYEVVAKKIIYSRPDKTKKSKNI